MAYDPEVPRPPQRFPLEQILANRINKKEIEEWREYCRDIENKNKYFKPAISLKDMPLEKQEEMKRLYNFRSK